MRLRRANESDERRKIRLTAHSQHMADVRSKETESEQSARLEAKRSITGSPGQMNIQKIMSKKAAPLSLDVNLNDELVQEQPQIHALSFILY